jgi:hypothetical protein
MKIIDSVTPYQVPPQRIAKAEALTLLNSLIGKPIEEQNRVGCYLLEIGGVTTHWNLPCDLENPLFIIEGSSRGDRVYVLVRQPGKLSDCVGIYSRQAPDTWVRQCVVRGPEAILGVLPQRAFATNLSAVAGQRAIRTLARLLNLTWGKETRFGSLACSRLIGRVRVEPDLLELQADILARAGERDVPST